MGGTFQLPGLQKYLQQNLQLPVEKLDTVKSLPPNDAKLAASFAEHAISLSGAYGLAIQAMGDAAITSSLLPTAIRRARLWKEKQKWFAAAAALFVAGTAAAAGFYFTGRNSYANNKSIRDENEATRAKASQLLNAWNNASNLTGDADKTWAGAIIR